MIKTPFDNKKYLEIQKKEILQRVNKFDKKLYIEFGGKLFDDFHAARVLPGFEKDSKLQVLLSLKDKVELVVVINAEDIKNRKIRSDLGISYEDEAERLIDAYRDSGLYVSSVVLSFFQEDKQVLNFKNRLEQNGIKVYKHYEIQGYPQNIPEIVSEDGLGKNEYVITKRPIVVITAPGPGSGKMATCLSQLYHDNKNNIRAGYAKYETFPVWNLPLNHPVNIAYEAATADLNDVNMIDPFHLEKYGKTATNYNRDIEVFPLLKAIFEKIYGESPYNSPTDMGVNMVGFAIKNDEAVQEAAKNEVIRRYYQAKKSVLFGKNAPSVASKIELLMNRLSITVANRKCVQAALDKMAQSGMPSMAIQLNKKKIVTSRQSDLLTASASLMLNSLKVLAHIDDSIPLISRKVIEPIIDFKVGTLKNKNPKIHLEEILIALAIQASNNPLADVALRQVKKLKGCEVHSSVVLTEADISTFKKLGINVTEEPTIWAHKIYIK